MPFRYITEPKKILWTWQKAYSDINVVVHLELFQSPEGLQGGDVLHLVIAQVQVPERRQLQTLRELLQPVSRQIPTLQRPQAWQQLHRKVLKLQRHLRQTEKNLIRLNWCFHRDIDSTMLHMSVLLYLTRVTSCIPSTCTCKRRLEFSTGQLVFPRACISCNKRSGPKTKPWGTPHVAVYSYTEVSDRKRKTLHSYSFEGTLEMLKWGTKVAENQRVAL